MTDKKLDADRVNKRLAMVNNRQFADVVFLVGEDQTRVYAHKAHLCNCEYFEKMFTVGMEESKPSSSKSPTSLDDDGEELHQAKPVALPDIQNCEAFLCVLDYIYAGSTRRIQASNVAEVGRLANQYLDTELLSECLTLIPTMMTIDNVFHLILFLRPLQVEEGMRAKFETACDRLVEWRATNALAMVQHLLDTPGLKEFFITSAQVADVETLSRRLPRIVDGDEKAKKLVEDWITQLVTPVVLRLRAKKDGEQQQHLLVVYEDLYSPKWRLHTEYQVVITRHDLAEAIQEFDSKSLGGTDLEHQTHRSVHRGCTCTQQVACFLCCPHFKFALMVYPDGQCVLRQFWSTPFARPRLVAINEGPAFWNYECCSDRVMQAGTIDEFRSILFKEATIMWRESAVVKTLKVTIGRNYTAELCLDVIARSFHKLPQAELPILDEADCPALLVHPDLVVETETALFDALVHIVAKREREAQWTFKHAFKLLAFHFIEPGHILQSLATIKHKFNPKDFLSIVAKVLQPLEATQGVRKGWLQQRPPTYYGDDACTEAMFVLAQGSRKRQREDDPEEEEEQQQESRKTKSKKPDA